MEPKAAKTRIVHLAVGGEGFDFLGFHHRLVRATGDARASTSPSWPAGPRDKAMQHARDRIRELTDRSRLLLPVEAIVQDVNRFLRGWAGYFRYGNSARHFDKINGIHADAAGAVRQQTAQTVPRASVGRWCSSNHRTTSGWSALTESSLAPRPFRAWRGRRMPAVNDVGEPCAGEPHARFDGRELETERP